MRIALPSSFVAALLTCTTGGGRAWVAPPSAGSIPSATAASRPVRSSMPTTTTTALPMTSSPASAKPDASSTSSPSSSSSPSSTSSSSSSAAPSGSSAASSPSQPDVVPFVKPSERVVRDDLPIVYCYDHCPFCVRVRFALGIKNVKHLLHFLANDDVSTPTGLVGKKISPILEWGEADVVMAESMDIIRLVDGDERLGPVNQIAPATGRTDLSEWQSSVRDLLRGLQRPRYVATGLLPEFQQLDGRHAFIRNHPMPPYGGGEWKDAMSMEEKLTVYAEGMAKDPATDIEELNRKLVELDDIVHCDHHCSPGGLSYDDVDLFSRLRSVTIIKDVEWPVKLRRYMDRMSELADLPLYDEMAL